MFLYLASRYTDTSPMRNSIMEERYHLALVATAVLTQKGITVYSPIVHYHRLALVNDLPRDVGFWSGHCENMLRCATGFLILDAFNWQKSKGVTWELELARDLKLGVSLVDPHKDYLLTTLEN